MPPSDQIRLLATVYSGVIGSYLSLKALSLSAMDGLSQGSLYPSLSIRVQAYIDIRLHFALLWNSTLLYEIRAGGEGF